MGATSGPLLLLVFPLLPANGAQRSVLEALAPGLAAQLQLIGIHHLARPLGRRVATAHLV